MKLMTGLIPPAVLFRYKAYPFPNTYFGNPFQHWYLFMILDGLNMT